MKSNNTVHAYIHPHKLSNFVGLVGSRVDWTHLHKYFVIKMHFIQFQGIMDKLFESFESVPTNNFAEFSASVFNWLEEYCKPQSLRTMVHGVLREQSYTP